MADCIFTNGNGDGDWSNAANWSGAVPVTNDNVYFTGTYNASVTTGMDQGGVDLDLLYIHESYSADVGSSGSPLLIAADKIIHAGQGGLFVESDANAAALLIDDILIMCANPSALVEIGGNPADKGEVQTVRILRGNVTMKANINYHASAHMEIGYIDSRETDATVAILHDSGTPANTTLPTYIQVGGKVQCNAILTDAEVFGGELTKEEAAIATLDLRGGRCNYNHTAGTTANVFADATFDLCKTHALKTITNGNWYPRAIIVKDDKLHTITNEVYYGQERKIS